MGLTRKEQAARSRQKLLDAAKELLEKKGYDAISIIDITSACGMSAGNFYNYFKTKEDIIWAIDREPYDSFLSELAKNTEQPVINQLRHYIKYYVDLATNHYGPNYNRQWYVRYLRPTNDPQEPTKLDILMDEVGQILIRGVHSGEFVKDTPVKELTQYIVFELHGMNIYHVMSEGGFDAAVWADKYCDFVENAILKQYIAGK